MVSAYSITLKWLMRNYYPCDPNQQRMTASVCGTGSSFKATFSRQPFQGKTLAAGSSRTLPGQPRSLVQHVPPWPPSFRRCYLGQGVPAKSCPVRPRPALEPTALTANRGHIGQCCRHGRPQERLCQRLLREKEANNNRQHAEFHENCTGVGCWKLTRHAHCAARPFCLNAIPPPSLWPVGCLHK